MMNTSNLELVAMSKQKMRNLLCLGLTKAVFGEMFMITSFCCMNSFYSSVRIKSFPRLSYSRLKADMTTPTKRFMMKNPPNKVIKTNTKLFSWYQSVLKPGTRSGPFELTTTDIMVAQLTSCEITTIYNMLVHTLSKLVNFFSHNPP